MGDLVLKNRWKEDYDVLPVLRKNTSPTVTPRCVSMPLNKPDSTTQSSIAKKRQSFLESRHVSEIDQKDSGLDSNSLSTSNSTNASPPRKRLMCQRSLSLPDVVTSTSPVFKDAPDVLDFEKPNGTRPVLKSDSDTSKKNTYPCHKCSAFYPQQKVGLGGSSCLHMSVSRSVSFKQDDEVISPDGNYSVSKQGAQGRQYLREKKASSGYGTGSDSSLSMDTGGGVEKSEAKEEEKEQKQNVCSDENISNTCTASNTPFISLLEIGSNGSLCLKDHIVQQLCQRPTAEVSPLSDPETISPLSQFCQETLQIDMNKQKTVPSPQAHVRVHLSEDMSRLKHEFLQSQYEREVQCRAPELCYLFFDELSYSITPPPKEKDTSELNKRDTAPVPGSEYNEPLSAELFGDGTCSNPFALMFDDKLIKDVEKACRCNDCTCCDSTCKHTKVALDDLRRTVEDCRTHLEPSQKKLLFALRCHSERCDDYCKVPWCRILNSIENWSINKAIQDISYAEGTFLDSATAYGKCVKITKSCQKRYKDNVKEGLHWYTLMPLNKFKNVVLAKEIQGQSNGRWAIKKTALNDYEQQIGVYGQLRKFTSPYIVEHHWAMEHGVSLLTCTEFKYGGSLRRVLNQTKIEHREIVSWMCQVIQGVLHLHNYDIIFLKWASKNIVISVDEKKKLKICDLSSSVLSTRRQAEYTDVKNSLPPTIIPPEMENNLASTVTEKADSWGCGCLLYELCNTYPVFHDKRHEKTEHLWSMMFRLPMPPLPEFFVQYQHILDRCWVKNPEHRGTLEEIFNLFLETRGHSLYKAEC